MHWQDFHDFTNHSPDKPGGQSADSERPRPMDPARRPEPFKTYLGDPETVSLPWDIDSWISGEPLPPGFGLNELARILLLGAGAKKFRSPRLKGRYFRTYASAGALHPNEIYVAVPDMDGVEEGMFHLDPKNRSLVRLGRGDARGELARAANDDELRSMSAVAVVTGIPWRTSWKYGPRGYRHLWWDAGMIVANFLALSGSAGHPLKVDCMFDDAVVNELIGVNGREEMTLAIVGMGSGSPGSGNSYTSLNLAPAALGPDPYEFVQISAVHSASAETASHQAAKSLIPSAPKGLPVERTIWKRGSTREFVEEATIPSEHLSTILEYADQPLPGDWGQPTSQFFLIAHSVDDLEPGAYQWNRSGLELLRLDPESRDSGHFLSLGQDLGAESAATIFPMAELDAVTEELGPRGYRAAQLEGAIRSGLMYLATYALGLGATGLTFYDEEVSKYFGVESLPMLEVAIGRPAARTPVRDPAEQPENLSLADPAIEDGVPKGWRGRIKGYRCSVDEGRLTLRSESKRASWCNVGQTIAARGHGKKFRLSAEVETDLSEGSWAGLYVTVAGKDGPLAMDNMQDRQITGRTEPTSYSVELPVDEVAESISFGILMFGRGEAGVADFNVEVIED